MTMIVLANFRCIKMGGANSKAAQLNKYGQFFSFQEKDFLTKTFQIIAGNEEATCFSEKDFQVDG